MSFLNITDPKRRDALVREYATSLQTIQQRNRNERLQNTTDERELAKLFSPVVKANEAVSTTVKNEINPLKRDLQSLTDSVKENTRERKRTKTTEDEGATESVNNDIAVYYLHTKKSERDNVYGIFTNSEGRLQMGTKEVLIQNNDIIVGDVTYQGTEGLWSLIMNTRPKSAEFTNRDVEHYKELLKQTDVIFEPNKNGSTRRPKTSTKWKRTIEPMIAKDSEFFADTTKKHGKGICNHQNQQQKQQQQQQQHQQQPEKQITFLPGDLAGLQTKMKLLLAEFLAGNKTTRNELVNVLDELKRRTKISKNDYTKINSLLASK
jgi:hypothetical protein